MSELTDLEVFGRHNLEQFALATINDEEGALPLISIVGAECDVFVSPDFIEGEDLVERMAHTIGLYGYPVDMVHVCATYLAHGLATDEQHLIETEAAARLAVITWAHTVPTNETLVGMAVKRIDDDGAVWYERVDLEDTGPVLSILEPLRYAAHDWDQFAISDGERKAKEMARRMLEQAADMNPDHVCFLDHGALLGDARRWDEERSL